MSNFVVVAAFLEGQEEQLVLSWTNFSLLFRKHDDDGDDIDGNDDGGFHTL